MRVAPRRVAGSGLFRAARIASWPIAWLPRRRRAQAADRQTILDGSRRRSTKGDTEFASAHSTEAGCSSGADERLGMDQQGDDRLLESLAFRLGYIPEVLQVVEGMNQGIRPRDSSGAIIPITPSLPRCPGPGKRLGEGHHGIAGLAHRSAEVFVRGGLDPAAEVLLLGQQVAEPLGDGRMVAGQADL